MTLEPRLCVKAADNCDESYWLPFLWVRVFRNTLIPSVKMTLTMNTMFAGIICQTIKREVEYSTAKEIVILASIFW